MYIQKRTFSMQTYLVSTLSYRSQIKVFALSTFCSFHIPNLHSLCFLCCLFSTVNIHLQSFLHPLFLHILTLHLLSSVFFIVVFFFFCSNLFFRTMSIGFLIKLCFVALFLHRVFPRRIAHRSRKGNGENSLPQEKRNVFNGEAKKIISVEI